MHRARDLRLWVGLLVLAVLGLPAPGSGRAIAAHGAGLPPEAATAQEPAGSKVLAPIEVSASFLAEPAPGQPAVLEVKVRPLVTAPNTTVRITLSDGFELVDGPLTWQGDIAQDETVALQVTLRAVREGAWTVLAEAVSQGPDGATFGRSDTLYTMVTPTGATVSRVPPQAPEPIAASAAERIAEGFVPQGPSPDAPSPKGRPHREAVSESPAVSPLGTITVYGYWYYRDKSGTDHPLRDARVEIWDDDSTSGDDLLGTTYTNSSGRYETTVNNDDVAGGQDIYVKIWSTDNHAVRVEDFSGNKYYAQTPTTDDVGDGTFYAGSYSITDANNRMAWFIYDKIANDAWYYLSGQVGWDNNYNLQVRWTPTSTDGTHYHFGGSIDLLAGDRWDEDVILHEYGHFTMDKIYATYPSTPNCNPHWWGVHSSTGCAWSEGWATFLQGAIQGHDDYVDTEDQTLHYYMEPPTPTAHHDQDEGAVNASLWDIFDTHDETWDSLDNGLNGSSNNGIWRIVYNDDPNNIQDFWNDWRASANGFCSQLWSILNHHSINYDTAAPSNPSSVWSTSHSTGSWSNDNTISVSWSGASDGCGSGVNGYSYAWSTSSGTIPDTSVDTTGTSVTSGALGNSSNWYFHIRTRDNAGNWNSGAVHLGPFRIDTSSPSNPTSVTETHGAPNNTWQRTVGDPAFTWSGASDSGGSGVAGYYVYWGTSSSGTSSYYTTSASYNPGAVSSPGVRYLRIRTRDNAGNLSGWTTLFTFKYDASAPSNPSSATETHGAPNNTWQNSVGDPAFTWSGASDGSGSGIAGYYYYWGTSSSGTSSNYTTSASYNPGAVSSPGVRYLRVQTRDNAGNTSSWTTLFTFRYDASPPSNPTSVSSSGHSVGVWSNDNTISVSWSGASDGSGSGVYGYSYEWSTSSTTIPNTSVNTTGTSGTSPALGNSSNWYFHIRTRDNAGNWNGGAVHLGPFRIDTSSPSTPTSVTETHGAPNNTWQNSVGDPAFTWSGASDGSGSGIAGYYYYWGTSSSGTSSNYTTSASYDPAAVSSPGVRYLRVQTRDNAGNTSSWTTLFTFRYDASAPSSPTSATETHGAPNNTWQNSVGDPAFTWSGASDGSGSGIAGYYYYWGTSSSGTSSSYTTSASYNPGAVSSPGTLYLRVQTRDNAGNTSSWTTLFTFRYDASAPSNPTSAIETHGAPDDAWQNSVGDPAFTWTGASDGSGSGVLGYQVYWGTDPSGTAGVWAGTASFDPGPVSSPSVYYLRVQTEDQVGNMSGWTTLFTFRYDATAPSNATSATETHGAPDGAWQHAVVDPDFIWSGASDGSGSGIAGYNVYWGTDPAGTAGTWAGTPGYDPAPVSSPSVHYLRVQAEDAAGNTSPWATLFTLKYDGSPPSNPSSVSSPSHSVGAWSFDDTIAVSWSGASDGSGSGVDGYSYEWSTSATTIPDPVVDTTGSSATSPPLGDSGTWYFHIRTGDVAGNWPGDAVHLGPFGIDATAPSNPTSATETHGAPDDAWQHSVADPAFTWSGASDGGGSGVVGYFLYWGTNPSGTSLDWTPGPGSDPDAVSSPSVHYLRVQTEDVAGNTAPWTTLFTFRYDASPPSNPSSISSSSHGTGVWSNDNTIAMSWSGATDGSGSGVRGYSYEWSTTASTIPDITMDTLGSSAVSPALSDGDSWYFHIRTRDVAGNWNGGAEHAGPYLLDTSAPSCTVDPLPPSQTAMSFAVTWSGQDAVPGSGLDTYDVQYRVGPAGVWTDWLPGTAAMSAAFGPSDPLSLQSGQTFYFRCRARDHAANLGAYPGGDGDTWTTVNFHSIFLPLVRR
jgi:hypothetical protein